MIWSLRCRSEMFCMRRKRRNLEDCTRDECIQMQHNRLCSKVEKGLNLIASIKQVSSYTSPWGTLPENVDTVRYRFPETKWFLANLDADDRQIRYWIDEIREESKTQISVLELEKAMTELFPDFISYEISIRQAEDPHSALWNFNEKKLRTLLREFFSARTR